MFFCSIILYLFSATVFHQISEAFITALNGKIYLHHPNLSIDRNDLCLLTTSHAQLSTEAQLLELNPIKSFFIKAGMIAYIASMCVALPLTLFPPFLLHQAKIISTSKKEKAALQTGQFCSRWLMRVIPFAKVKVLTDPKANDEDPEPSIWVCNHTSMLDVFFLLAFDKDFRGNKKRPIKILYWKALEKNPITALVCKMCGFLPVEMEKNVSGNSNQYKKSSFKTLLKGIKKAFDDGWDIGIIPEGRINPCPEKGLLPVFSGAFTIAKISKRPIRMLGLYGVHKLWHGGDSIGMITGREVKIRAYPFGRRYEKADEFAESFKTVIGHFGATGEDHPEWQRWMNGSAWNE